MQMAKSVIFAATYKLTLQKMSVNGIQTQDC